MERMKSADELEQYSGRNYLRAFRVLEKKDEDVEICQDEFGFKISYHLVTKGAYRKRYIKFLVFEN